MNHVESALSAQHLPTDHRSSVNCSGKGAPAIGLRNATGESIEYAKTVGV